MKKLIIITLLAGMSSELFAISCDDPRLKEVIADLNANVPEKLEDSTILTGVTCQDGNLQFSYDMENIGGIEPSKFNDKQIMVFKNMQENLMKDVYCNSLKELHEYTNSII